jgi:hypothetical protein
MPYRICAEPSVTDPRLLDRLSETDRNAGIDRTASPRRSTAVSISAARFDCAVPGPLRGAAPPAGAMSTITMTAG